MICLSSHIKESVAKRSVGKYTRKISLDTKVAEMEETLMNHGARKFDIPEKSKYIDRIADEAKRHSQLAYSIGVSRNMATTFFIVSRDGTVYAIRMTRNDITNVQRYETVGNRIILTAESTGKGTGTQRLIDEINDMLENESK